MTQALASARRSTNEVSGASGPYGARGEPLQMPALHLQLLLAARDGHANLFDVGDESGFHLLYLLFQSVHSLRSSVI